MNRDHVRAFARILERHRLRFIVVGGAAVFRAYPSESRDVGALLLTREYARGIESLDRDPSVVAMTREPGETAGGHFLVGTTVVRFDILDPAAFSGTRAGDEFFDYVYRYGSRDAPEGRVATVPVVWYMRLVIEGEAWQVQVQKILRDLRAGAPWSRMADVRRIARRFGRETRVGERIVRVREEGRRAGVLPYPDEPGRGPR